MVTITGEIERPRERRFSRVCGVLVGSVGWGGGGARKKGKGPSGVAPASVSFGLHWEFAADMRYAAMALEWERVR